VIPLKAIILNLLSVGAAYGVMVWIFQKGHLESLLGFKSNGAIVSWMPRFMFVVLFGLSMDYHVFILTRIREAFDRGRPTEDAVSHGIKMTAGVVTSAAAVMISVFATSPPCRCSSSRSWASAWRSRWSSTPPSSAAYCYQRP
jgi:uncharacterized membrane protein YdfJ with MMPL/SSD domain